MKMYQMGGEKKIIYRWTCSDFCHIPHRFKWIAWLHGRWIYFKREVL